MAGYQVRLETFCIGGHNMRIRSLKDRQQFHDPDGQHERNGIPPASWPLFGVIWPSALILADTMHHYPVEGIKILEVGCGLALASLVVRRRGGDITATDYHPLAQSFLEKNVALNDFIPIDFQRGDWAASNPLLGKFDLIIGSDLLYERNHPELLSNFISDHSSKNVKVIIIDPNRGHQSKFTHKMRGHGYSFNSDSVMTQTARDIHFKGKILTYLRNNSG